MTQEHGKRRETPAGPTISKACCLLVLHRTQEEPWFIPGAGSNGKVVCMVEDSTVMNKGDAVAVEGSAFLSEDCFQTVLIHERNRTERLGAHFMLVLVDVGWLLNQRPYENEVLVKNLELALESSAREFDWKGWYLHNKLLGILCPRAAIADKNRIIDGLRQEFSSFLAPGEAGAIKIYCLSSPDTRNERDAEAPAVMVNETLPWAKGFS
jgi:hypothetical protein